MRVFQIENEWGMDNLRLSSRPDPAPGPGEALLRMRAAALNYRDLLVVDRGYGSRTGTLPLIPLCDGVGEVVAVGAGVSRVGVGDRVMPCYQQGWIGGAPNRESFARTLGGPLDGTMAELMCVQEQGLVKAPAYLSDAAAATLPCAAVTAWNAVVSHGAVRPGDRVLVQGTGGVALFAIQVARLLGAHVTVVSSSDRKIERARSLGAEAAINYARTPEWAKATRDITADRGYDLIVELGGEKTLPQSLRCVRPGGTIAMIGVLSGGTLSGQLGYVVTRQVRLQGVTVGPRESFEAMLRAFELHRVEPVIDRVFAFDELKQAMAYLASGAHVGKVCIAH